MQQQIAFLDISDIEKNISINHNLTHKLNVQQIHSIDESQPIVLASADYVFSQQTMPDKKNSSVENKIPEKQNNKSALIKSEAKINTKNQMENSNKEMVVVISIDDLNKDPSNVKPVMDYLKSKNIPVTLFPINEKNQVKQMENVQENLDYAKAIKINSQVGRHGYNSNKLDPLLPETDDSVIAWPSGNQLSTNLSSGFVARGTTCDLNRWGEFDQHYIKSCTVSNNQNEINQRRKVIDMLKENGGALSIHLHNMDGLKQLKEDIENLQKDGAKFEFIKNLKNKGGS